MENQIVAAPPAVAPAFGRADLTNCETEQIHLAGSIQPHGALIVIDERTGRVIQASTNAAEFIDVSAPILGRRLEEISSNLAKAIAAQQGEDLSTIPAAVRCTAGRKPVAFDCLAHRLASGGLVIEFERAARLTDRSKFIAKSLQTIIASTSMTALADDTAKIFKDLTGYDRVMVYRFDTEGHGEVFAERRKARLEPYLGNRYPSTDIPQIARKLYERNRVRIVADVEFEPIPLEPTMCPLTGREPDMSLCYLRSTSPIHIQYLKNMGVAATLVISLVVGGRLWGLISCHHYVPRTLHFGIRSICELLAEAVATRIAALENFLRAQSELSVRRLEQRMMEMIAREGDWRAALLDNAKALLQPVGATGAALLFEGQVHAVGEVPDTQQLRDIGLWLARQPRAPIISTTSLGLDEPQLLAVTPVASGVIATPISNDPSELLIWLRPERIRTVTWGGDPFKPMLIGNDPTQLSPRRSFAQWHQVVEGTSDPWTAADISAARLIGDTVRDVIFQSRSVQLLIARNQLEQVTRQVGEAEQLVVICDSQGQLVLANKAFRDLLPQDVAANLTMDHLPDICADGKELRDGLRDLLRHKRSLRLEAHIMTRSGDPRPMLVRADPVLAAPEHVLGYVVLFSDQTDRKAAEVARRRLQDGLFQQRRAMSANFDTRTVLPYRELASSLLENAQLAALEITDGLEMARMPAMLDSVWTSILRSSHVLKQLAAYTGSDNSSEDD